MTTERPSTPDLLTTEEAVGRPFDFVYRFHDLNDQIPNDDERELVRLGRILHVSIDATNFAPGSEPITWKAVTNGAWDPWLRAQAEGIASLEVPVFVTFEHEPDLPLKESRGTPADFRAAWRHVRTVFQEAGADNAIWTWVASGWPPAFERAGSLWPGDDVVDWISWDAYNQSGCRDGDADVSEYVPFREAVGGFYRWLVAHGGRHRIDITKPMMISEAGTIDYPEDPRLAARWYLSIPEELAAMPQIKAIGLWDHTGTGHERCDFRFSRAPHLRDAVKAAGRHRWANVAVSWPGAPGAAPGAARRSSR